MRVLTQIFTDCMKIYEHDLTDISDAMDVSSKEALLYVQGKTVPSWDVVKNVCYVYHLDETECRQAWVKAREKSIEKERRCERQYYATLYLRNNLSNANDLNSRMLAVMALSQYYHNIYIEPSEVSYSIDLVMKMRNEFVYNIGSNQYDQYSQMLLNDDLWQTILTDANRSYGNEESTDNTNVVNNSTDRLQ